MLDNLSLMKNGRSKRQSSWDRTGGNKDNVTIMPNATAVLAEMKGAGVVRHIWFTIAHPDRFHMRKIILRMFWDGEDSPSVEVPVGDFFGVGNCQTIDYASAPLCMSPRLGKSLNCYFPMPYGDGARIEIENQSDMPCLAFYYYIDYEEQDKLEGDHGRFHAWWNREAPCEAVDYSDQPMSFGFKGFNLSDKENYLILDAEGRGHYAGVTLNVYNHTGGWYGEGDDMIFIDGEGFPPSLHGTGTEDYFGSAWSPDSAFCTPYHGLPLTGQLWQGFISLYRFHIPDPIRFQKSIRVSIEHGHANDRGDDYSSVAYWYQTEPHKKFDAIRPVADRMPPYPDEELGLLNKFNELYMEEFRKLDLKKFLIKGDDPKVMKPLGRLFGLTFQADMHQHNNDFEEFKKVLEKLADDSE